MPSIRAAEEAIAYSRAGGLVAATLILVIVLTVCYLCIRLLKKRRPFCAKRGPRDQFEGWVPYLPSCSGRWYSKRHGCTGVTSGAMPSIETTEAIFPCCGARTGVPPPEYNPQSSPRQN